MPGTWREFSKYAIGYVAPQIPDNEDYVAYVMVSKWLNEDKLTAEQVALRWNQGNTGDCSKGTNKYGVKYDSCHYVKKFTSAFITLDNR